VTRDAIDAVAAFEALGGTLELHGEQVEVVYQTHLRQAVSPLLGELRAHREAVRAFLRERSSGGRAPAECPPLPPAVRLLRYAPKVAPVAVQPCSIVTDVGKFIRAYLEDLEWRLAHPNTYACASLPEILAKLAEVGVELKIEQAQVPREPHAH